MMRLTRRAVLVSAAGVAVAPNFARSAQPPDPDDTGFVDVTGGKVWWRRFGKGQNKTPLLLLHGGPGAGHNYLLPMHVLADERPVIVYDQLGCGRSDAPEDAKYYTFERFVEEIDLLRQALGLHRVILFGNSWGGMLAIEYLVSGHGLGVEKLVLSGSLASIPQASAGMNRLIDNLPNGAGKRIRELEAAGKQGTKEYEDLVGLFYATHLCRRNPLPPEFEATVANLVKSPAYRIMNGPNEFTIVGTIKDWERRADLRLIKVPTLITTGEFDEITIDCQETLHTAIDGSQLVVMPGASHLTMLEQPEVYNAIVRKFIAQS